MTEADDTAAWLRDLTSVGAHQLKKAAQAGAWAEGLLGGSALLLLHHDGVWKALDDWIVSLAPEVI